MGRGPPPAAFPPAGGAPIRRRRAVAARRAGRVRDRVRALDSGWRIDREPAVLDLPGAGMCVPDLAFVRARDGARVHFELLGFWSREAVWRRVELVRAGLPHKILFAVSKGLRVGEAVLDETPTAALYVFARVIAAKQVLDRIERLAGANLIQSEISARALRRGS